MSLWVISFHALQVLGVVNLTFLCLLIFRIHQNLAIKTAKAVVAPSKLYKYKFFAAILAALIPLLQLNGRVGASGGSSNNEYGSGDVAPFEILSFSWLALDWILVVIALWQERKVVPVNGGWILRFLWLFSFFCQSIKLYFVWELTSTRFFSLNFP